MSGLSTLADVYSTALPQAIPGMTRQVNNVAVILSDTPTEPGEGKNLAHDIELDGATASSYAEGSDVSTFDVNQFQLAILPWAHYRTSFWISETKVNAAMTSKAGFKELGKFFMEHIHMHITKLASVQNQDFISATGTDGSGNPNFAGLLGTALLATGTYAGLSRSSFPLWQSTVLGNGGVLRPLSSDLFFQAEQQTWTKTNSTSNTLWLGGGLYRKYAGLFENIRRFEGADVGGDTVGTGGFKREFWGDIEIKRDKDMDLLAPNSAIMGNKDYVMKQYLPEVEMDVMEGEDVEEVMGFGDNGENVVTPTGLPVKIFTLGKTGDSYKVVLKSVANVLVTRPAGFCVINDIDNS